MADIGLNFFSGQNWLITPAALAVGESPPATILDQKWLLVLSGVVEADLQGNNPSAWRKETVSFIPGNNVSLGIGLNEGPLNWAINQHQYDFKRPPNPQD